MGIPSRWRYAVPAAVAAAALAAAALPGTASASAHPQLPERTAADLLAAVQGVRPTPFSGVVSETVSLGLPALPGADRSTPAGLDPTLLLTGTHQIRVWAGTGRQLRAELVGQYGDLTADVDGTTLWTYTSASNAVTRTALPSRRAADGANDRGGVAASPAAMTPAAVAQLVLTALDPTTAVTVDRTARVAGRAAYQLVLSPRDGHSLIRSVRIALDAVTTAPLRVEVYGRSAGPVLSVGFRSLRLTAPAASTFRFRIPRGATVTTITAPAAHPAGTTAAADPATPDSAAARPTVIGSGWAAVLRLPAGRLTAADVTAPVAGATATAGGAATATGAATAGGAGDSAAAGGGSAALLRQLRQLGTPVAGGTLVTTAIGSLFLRSDGTAFLGAVSGADLLQVASTGQPV